MEVTHRYFTTEQLQRDWKGKRLIFNQCHSGCYGGWTGYEHFGVIRAFRYYGWRVTCWGHVAADAFGDARDSIFFDEFDDAAIVLAKLMEVAKRMRVLARRPVRYADHKFFGIKPFLPLEAGLGWIYDGMQTNSRAPTSPASWRHFMRRYPDDDHGKPVDPKLANRLGGEMWASYLREHDGDSD
jgi:hypothetical protein